MGIHQVSPGGPGGQIRFFKVTLAHFNSVLHLNSPQV